MSKTRVWILAAVGLLVACTVAGVLGARVATLLQGRAELDTIAGIYRQGDLEQSRTRLLAYLEAHPSDAVAWTILGHVYEGLDEDAEAERAYLKAIEHNAKSYEAYTGLGVLARKQQDYDRALDYYNQAIAINPDYAQAYSSMAVIELKRYQDQRALELAEKAYSLDQEDPVVAANLAVAYHYNGRIADRDRMHEECRKLGYDNIESLGQIFSGELTIRD
jgi:tetratricopeptide (TPR) repeat protein